VAPLPTNATVLPAQTVFEDALITGEKLPPETTTVALLLPLQPAVEVPITLYAVVVVGVTTIELPLADVFHVYVEAPETENETGAPGQTVTEEALNAGFAVSVIIGGGTTVTFTAMLPVQPLALVPVTV
jgi:hypothetical protein